MEKQTVRLKCLKTTFAFGQLIKQDEVIQPHTALLIPAEDMVDGKNPPKYAHCAIGYANVPDGFFRITPIGEDEVVAAADAEAPQVSPDGMDVATKIIKALGELDPDLDEDWTTTGEPRMDRVIDLVGEQVTRNEVEEAFPGFSRSTAVI